MNKCGEVSWTDTVVDSSAKKNNKDSFLRLNPGSNIIRLLTKPYQYYQHKYKVEGEKGFGHRISCSAVEHKVCAVCELGDKAKRRWLLGVIDRKTNTYKILDVGYSVFKSIQTLARDDDWGDPSKYDIDIVVDQNGGPTGYYSVISKPPKPLSANDLLIKDENDPEELNRRVVPPTPDRVKERLDKIMEQANGTSSKSTSSSNSSSNDDDDEETDFKDYDSTKKVPF